MHITSKMVAAALALLAAGSVSAQTVQGPVMGYVVDSHSRNLRPVLGVPGAAVVGATVKADNPIVPAAVSPAGDYALVWMNEGGKGAVWTPAGELKPLAGLSAATYAVALSPQGAAAAFYSPEESVVRVVSGLPDSPSDAVEFRLDTVGAPLASFAVSDDGAVVLCAAAGPGAEAIALSPSGELARIPFSAAITALAFVPSTHDAVIADGAEALLVKGVDAHGSTSRLDAGKLGAISAVAVTGDSRQVLLAASNGKIAIAGLASGAPTTVVDCHCAPEGLFRMNGDGAWRLDGYRGASIHVLDTASAEPRIVVVTASMGPGNTQ